MSTILHSPVVLLQKVFSNLGVRLNVPSQQLEVVRSHDAYPHLCIEEVLKLWLCSDKGSPTGQLTDVLKKMGHDSLAQKIHNQFAGSPGERIGIKITGV